MQKNKNKLWKPGRKFAFGFRNPFESGKIHQGARELFKHDLDIMALSEWRWNHVSQPSQSFVIYRTVPTRPAFVPIYEKFKPIFYANVLIFDKLFPRVKKRLVTKKKNLVFTKSDNRWWNDAGEQLIYSGEVHNDIHCRNSEKEEWNGKSLMRGLFGADFKPV